MWWKVKMVGEGDGKQSEKLKIGKGGRYATLFDTIKNSMERMRKR